jgi:protocatechuate 3,4-dioxygenase beta subunit
MLSSIRIAVLLLTAFSLSYSMPQKCKCQAASPDATTSWGQENLIIKNESAVNSLKGEIVGGYRDEPMDGVLVEVYDKPEALLMDAMERQARKPSQHRVAACVTGANGEFCFPGIPPGKYELRCSKPGGWNVTSLYIVVSSRTKRGNNSKLVVSLQPGN